MALLIVIPVCSDDEDLCYTTQSMAHHFSGQQPYGCLVVTAQDRPLARPQRLFALLDKTYTGVSRLIMPHRGPAHPWPNPQNQMFIRVCQYMVEDLKGLYDSFFYMEPDVWPLRSNWLQDLHAEHLNSGKLYTGPVVGMPWDDTLYPHLNGAAVYPSNVLHLAPSLVLASETPWDVYARDYITPGANDISKTLQHHSFRSRDYSGTLSNLSYTQDYTKAMRDPKDYTKILREEFSVKKNVDLTGFALLHGCKDKSLIDVLIPPTIAVAPIVEVPPLIEVVAPAEVVPAHEPQFDPIPDMIAEEFGVGVEEEIPLEVIDETPAKVYTPPEQPTSTRKRRARRSPYAKTHRSE